MNPSLLPPLIKQTIKTKLCKKSQKFNQVREKFPLASARILLIGNIQIFFLKRKKSKNCVKIPFALVRDLAVFIFLNAESSPRVDFSLGMETFPLESVVNRIPMLRKCGRGPRSSAVAMRPSCTITQPQVALQLENHNLGLRLASANGVQGGVPGQWGCTRESTSEREKMIQTFIVTYFISFKIVFIVYVQNLHNMFKCIDMY